MYVYIYINRTYICTCTGVHALMGLPAPSLQSREDTAVVASTVLPFHERPATGPGMGKVRYTMGSNFSERIPTSQKVVVERTCARAPAAMFFYAIPSSPESSNRSQTGGSWWVALAAQLMLRRSEACVD